MRILVLLLLAGCAAQPEPQLKPAPGGSLLPGSIGVLVKRVPAGVVVAAVRGDGVAAAAGVRAGDVIVRYNGAIVANPREFNRLVVDSQPGSTARVEILRGGDVHRVEVPVHELDTMPRV